MKPSKKEIQLCINRDRRVQFELYKRYFPFLMRICLRYKTNNEEARSLLNQGFYKILSNLNKYDPNKSFLGWIKKIQINVIIDEFRKSTKITENETVYPETIENIGIDINLADQVLEAELFEAMIRQLPNVSQKVFNLFAIDGYSHKEIAALLKISVNTSKWHMSTARKQLQIMVNKHLEYERKVLKHAYR